MRLFVDLDTKSVIASAGERAALSSLSFKRGDSSVIDVYFVQGGVVQDLGNGSENGILGLKDVEDYAGDYVVAALSWTKGTDSAGATYYRLQPSFNTVALNERLIDGTVSQYVADQAARYALTGLDAGTIVGQEDNTTFWRVKDADKLGEAAGWETAPQRSSISLMMELEWIVAGSISSINTLTVTVPNDVIKGNEGVPLSATPAYPPPAQLLLWRSDITGLTGGGATNLDGLTTANGQYNGRLIAMVEAGSPGTFRLYELIDDPAPGVTVEDDPGIILPDDHDPVSNPKIWIQRL
jgi:hypothetical protein